MNKTDAQILDDIQAVFKVGEILVFTPKDLLDAVENGFIDIKDKDYKIEKP